MPESLTVAEVFEGRRTWATAQEELLEENLLKKTRSFSSYLYFREIRDRLQYACMGELRALAGAGGVTPTDPGELQRPRLSAGLHDRYCREGGRKDYGHLLWREEFSWCVT